MLSRKNACRAVTVYLLQFLLVTPSTASSLTSYRIYLDRQNSNTSFLIFNRELQDKECKISLRHYKFDELSNITGEFEKTPANSAKEFIRFSPRKFTITPGNSQTVRFALRRKPNSKDAEYRSFLKVDCSAVSNKTSKKISISPRLVHNVPIVVRTGKLDGAVSFSNFAVDGSKLTFNLNRTGERSIYGIVELIDDEGNTVSFLRGVSIYPESKSKQISFSTNDIPVSKLKVRFTEDKNYGGSIIQESKIN